MIHLDPAKCDQITYTSMSVKSVGPSGMIQKVPAMCDNYTGTSMTT
jgi:hypothetical protein